LRVNTSCLSQEELDYAEELDIGNPQELGRQHDHTFGYYTHINILGDTAGRTIAIWQKLRNQAKSSSKQRRTPSIAISR